MSNIKIVTSDLLNMHGIRHGWFMKHGGVSEGLFKSLNGKKGGGDSNENVDENRKRAPKALYADENRGLSHIVHEFKTNILEASKPGEFKFYDASYTTESDLVLSQTTADCASVIIADTNQKVAALVHGSWHTLKANIICDVVAKLKQQPGIDELAAGIGPMICRNCYEFGPEAKDLFDTRYLTPVGSKFVVDLKQMVIDQLQESGIRKIDDLNICTKEDDRFFSHRRSGEHSGRMITLVSLC